MLYAAGLASADPASSRLLIDGYVYGSLSMTSYLLGAQDVAQDALAAPPADLEPPPFPDIDPADTNL